MGSGIRGFLDASVEFCNWLKYVRSTNQSEAQNVRTLLLAGQVGHYYCVVTVLFCHFYCLSLYPSLSLSHVMPLRHVTSSSSPQHVVRLHTTDDNANSTVSIVLAFFPLKGICRYFIQNFQVYLVGAFLYRNSGLIRFEKTQESGINSTGTRIKAAKK